MDGTDQKMSASQILLTFASFVIVVAGMRASVEILVPFLLAIFIAIIGAAPLTWLKSKQVPGWLALIIIIAGIFLIGFLLAWLVGASIRDFSGNLPIYEKQLTQQMATVMNWLNEQGIDTSTVNLTEIFDPGSAMALVASGLNSLGSVLTNVLLIALTVIFILLEASSIPAKLRLIIGQKDSSMEPFEEFIETVKNYMAIKSLVSLITGVLVAVWVYIMGVDYPLLWGLLAFALNFVPNIGSIIAAIPVVLLSLIQIGPINSLIVAIGFIVINLVIGNAVEPRFMGRGLGLSTLVVFLSLIFWGWVLGPIGMLLSVPLTITAKIAFDVREETRWLAVLLGPNKSKEAAIRSEMKSKIWL